LAGFFGFFNYAKPGPGVDVNAPPKKAYFRFWELYWRKFSRFIALNMIVFAFLLPIITLLFLMYMGWSFSLLERAGEIPGLIAEAEQHEGMASIFGALQSILLEAASMLPPLVSFLLLAASAVFYGPVMCGMTYILRNFSREEHAWLSDFFVRMKSNFRQGAILGLLELLALGTLFFNILTPVPEDGIGFLNASMPLIRYISIFLVILVLFARNYIYAMAVTFDIKTRSIIKNGFAFAFVGLFRNFGVLLCALALIFAMLAIPFADIVLLPFFFFTFTGFLSTFATFPLIYKYMVLPQTKESDGTEPDGAEQDAV